MGLSWKFNDNFSCRGSPSLACPGYGKLDKSRHSFLFHLVSCSCELDVPGTFAKNQTSEIELFIDLHLGFVPNYRSYFHFYNLIMKYKKIVLAGGNGYLGRVLTRYYQPVTEEIIILSRNNAGINENVKTIHWDAKTSGTWEKCLEGADLLINLCGKNVNCRYTAKNRTEIIDSRIIPTRLLGKAIEKSEIPPKLWINVTSATIYRHAEDRPQDEESGAIGYGFSIDVCKKWEETFFNIHTPLTRKVALRMGIVLGSQDGVFPRLLNLVKFGLGGKQGDGQQYVSWIHEQDAAKCTEWLMQKHDIEGIVNCTAPEPVKNTDLMFNLRNIYGIPLGLPSPAWLLKIGAIIIGTETELILKSRWVMPKRLIDNQYQFMFPKLQHALKDILSTSV